MQTQLGLGGLTPGVASAPPLPARLRLSPVSTRKSEQAPLSSWSIVCAAPTAASQTRGGQSLTSSYFAQESFAANCRTPAQPCGDSCPTQRDLWRLLATLAEALYQRACLGWVGGRGEGEVGA